ncbi:MAG TPA: hypothetical protein VMT76_13440 [Puia sp.]|nr:hypothetical protein [Puia sp.]
MKKPCVIFSVFLIIHGCAPSYTVSVSAEKELAIPFNSFLVIYLDGACEINFLDSTTYDVCLKDIFADTSSFQFQVESEKTLSKRLSSSHNDIKKFTDFFDAGNNSYAYFRNMLDSLKIDAILLINRTGYQHVPLMYPGNVVNTTNTSHIGTEIAKLNAEYKCYLIQSHSYFPIWSAKFDFTAGRKTSIRNTLAKELTKVLRDGHYIFR